MRESEIESGRSTGETAKCPLVRRVSDLGHTANTGAHGKTSVRRVSWIWAHSKLFFIFNFKSVYGKNIWQNTTLPCARGMAHGEVKTSPCARCQAHGEHGISIFHVNETCILLNFSMSFWKFVLKLKTRH